MGWMIRGIDDNISFRFFLVDSTDVVREAATYHRTTPVASAALGRVLTAGLMMGYTMKNDRDRLTVRINGGGPIGNIIVTADSSGHIKGYCDNPYLPVEIKNGKLDVGKAVGTDGKVTVIKDMGLKEPYIGSSDIVTGEIGDDLAAYYVYSEQQPSVVGLGVLVSPENEIISAGGFMFQLMPEVSESEIEIIEDKISRIKNVSSYFSEGKEIEEVAKDIFAEFNIEITEKIPVSYKCDCSRERMKGIIISLGKKEIQKIISEDDNLEINCHFCSTSYRFEKDELQKMADEL